MPLFAEIKSSLNTMFVQLHFPFKPSYSQHIGLLDLPKGLERSNCFNTSTNCAYQMPSHYGFLLV